MGIIWKTPAQPRRRRKRAARPVRRNWTAVLARITARLEQVRDAEGMSMREFSRKLGLPAPTYHHMVTRRRPTVEAICGAALAFGISPRWLLDGHGEQRIRVQDWYAPDTEPEA